MLQLASLVSELIVKFLHELLVEMKPGRDCTEQEHLVSSIKPSLYGREAMFREPNR